MEEDKPNGTDGGIDYEQYAELELVAYGCHRRVSYGLSNFLNEQGIQSFTFYDFFAMQPVARNDNELEKIRLFCPFVKRYAIGSPLLPFKVEELPENSSEKVAEGTSEGGPPTTLSRVTLLRNRENLIAFYRPLFVHLQADTLLDTPEVLERWKNGEKTYMPKLKDLRMFEDYVSSGEEGEKREFALVDFIWYEYVRTNKGNQAAFLYTPIASDNFFYGVLLLIVGADEIDPDSAVRCVPEGKKGDVI